MTAIEGIRWLVKEETRWEPTRRGGSIVYGGPSQEVTREVKVLQFCIGDTWLDVRSVREEEAE